jgi:hypothetical protein
MPDKNLTDAEIVKTVKSYEEKILANGIKSLEPFEVREIVERQQEQINRQQAENERLKTENRILSQKRVNLFERLEIIDEAKAEAYKEFADRLNKEAEKVDIDREGDFVSTDDKLYDTVADWCKVTSNNLLKELVGE